MSLAERKRYVESLDAKVSIALSRFTPDIAHVHHGWIIGSILARQAVPYVVSLHGTEGTAFDRYPAFQPQVLAGLHCARRVIALSEAQRQSAIQRYGLPPQRVSVVPGGTDTHHFRPIAVDRAALLSDLGVPVSTRPVVLFAGRLIHIKGVDVLLRAVQRFEVGPLSPITLIAGEGECGDRYRQMAGDLGLVDVFWLGFQNHDKMVRLYNLADVVVLPSREDTFPLVALEALACGIPVVSSRVGSLRQIVGSAFGRMVERENDAALAEAIQRVIATHQKNQIRELAATFVDAHFAMTSAVASVEGIYRQVLAEDDGT